MTRSLSSVRVRPMMMRLRESRSLSLQFDLPARNAVHWLHPAEFRSATLIVDTLFGFNQENHWLTSLHYELRVPRPPGRVAGYSLFALIPARFGLRPPAAMLLPPAWTLGRQITRIRPSAYPVLRYVARVFIILVCHIVSSEAS